MGKCLDYQPEYQANNTAFCRQNDYVMALNEKKIVLSLRGDGQTLKSLLLNGRTIETG